MQGADDALLVRFMWVWPDAMKFDRPKRPPATEWAITALDRLRMLELAQGEYGRAVPLVVTLDRLRLDHWRRPDRAYSAAVRLLDDDHDARARCMTCFHGRGGGTQVSGARHLCDDQQRLADGLTALSIERKSGPSRCGRGTCVRHGTFIRLQSEMPDQVCRRNQRTSPVR
jgi:hypothetical protein